VYNTAGTTTGIAVLAASDAAAARRSDVQQLETVPYLLYEPEDTGILWIRFNRPERLNAAVGGAERTGTLAKVGEYMCAGDDDPNMKVIVLTGVGRGF
jgi:1,4-dihydroxy-2-naphthoyl-CoA synthase